MLKEKTKNLCFYAILNVMMTVCARKEFYFHWCWSWGTVYTLRMHSPA